MIPSFPYIGGFLSLLSLCFAIIIIISLLGRRTRRLYVIFFIVSTITASLWIIINTVLLPLEKYDLDILVDLSFASSVIMVTNIWLFTKYFGIRYSSKITNILTKIFIFLGILFFVLSLTTNYIIQATTQDSTALILEFGSLYFVYSIYFLSVFFAIAVLLIIRYRNEKGKIKQQLKYFSVGFLLTAFISVITNLLLPYFTGDSSSSRIGPFGMIFFLSLSTFAIVKYQFLEIRVLVGRITYYSIFMVLFLVSYYGIYVFDHKFFGGAFTWGAFISGLVIAAFFSYFFVKFNDYLRVQVRTRIINPGYDPLEVLDVLSRKVASLLDINKIIDVSIHSLDQTVRADYESLIVMPTDRRQREFIFESTNKSKDLDLVLFSELKQIWNDIGNIPIVYHEIEYEMPEIFGKYSVTIEKIFKYMSQKHIRLILPLRESEKNPGMLILGQKESDGIYTMQDIEFVQGVATTIGLAMTRAFYFLEAQDLNVNLQKRVDEATKELQYKNRRLEKAMKKIEDIRQQERDMIDVMGHELRTPITIVRNALLVLLSKIKGKKEVKVENVKEYVEKALESARREINLVETLLSATKVESNRIQMNLTKIDMIDVVEDSLEAHNDIAKDKKIKIRFQKPKKKVWGYADRTRMQEVMDNFLSNAVKYTLRGEVKIWIETKSKDVQILIQDTGIGISEEDIARLGKKFFRAKQYLKDDDGETNGVVRPGGTGLGLYVSFNLIRIMQGKVEVKSKVGQGSIFAFSVPKFSNQPDRHIDQTFEEQI